MKSESRPKGQPKQTDLQINPMELEILKKNILEAVRSSPKKAATILTLWMNQSSKRKQTRMKKAG